MIDIEENNVVYACDLLMLKNLSIGWRSGHPQAKAYKMLIVLAAAVGLAIAFYVLATVPMDSRQLPLNESMWLMALLVLLAARYGYKRTKPPFGSFHNVRAEIGDNHIYFIYQNGMKEFTYAVADEDIKEMIYDEKYKTLYIKGRARLQSIGRKQEVSEGPLTEIYMLLPFANSDINNMLVPYSEMLNKTDGGLRDKYIKENQ